jgi:uncharacterized membrane protein HdeD (DUF308 family)
MVGQRSRMSPRTEFFIGLLITLVGVLAVVVGVAVDARWVWVAGIVIAVLGAFAVIGMVSPRRHDGTRIWQTDQGSSGGAGAGGGGG